MSYIPDEELKERPGLSLAPMIDFLFIMLAVFASLAVSRIVMQETEIDLVRSPIESTSTTPDTFHLVHITITETGDYSWNTEIRDYPLASASAIATELLHQHERGLLPKEKLHTQVLLKIDRQARWEPILNAMLAIKDAGFEVRPVYEPA